MTRVPSILTLACMSVLLTGCRESTNRVRIGEQAWTVELADTLQKRYKGLSERSTIPADTGMLFIFDDVKPRTFVMRNCPVPIDVIFIGPDKRVVNLYEMQPQPELIAQPGPADRKPWREYSSHMPAKWVLELAGGQIQAAGIQIGDTVTLELAGGGE